MLPCLFFNMSRKKVIGIIFCVLACIVAITIINSMEKNKADDLRAVQNEETAENTNMENDDLESQTMDSENMEQKQESDKTLKIGVDLQIEFLSCDVIDDTDIAEQTIYPAEFFYSGILPSFNPDEPRKTYLFTKCIVKNVSGKAVEHCIDLYAFIRSDESEYLGLREGLCYFDKAEYIDGEDRQKRFFWYRFDEDEELECVLGFEVREGEAGKENEQYYIGNQPLNVNYFTIENTKGLIIPITEMGD